MPGKRKDSVAPRYRLRVKQRTAIVAYAIEHGVLPASRRFGLDRKTIREWRDRWHQHRALVRAILNGGRRVFPKTYFASSSMRAASSATGRHGPGSGYGASTNETCRRPRSRKPSCAWGSLGSRANGVGRPARDSCGSSRSPIPGTQSRSM